MIFLSKSIRRPPCISRHIRVLIQMPSLSASSSKEGTPVLPLIKYFFEFRQKLKCIYIFKLVRIGAEVEYNARFSADVEISSEKEISFTYHGGN